MRIRLARLLLVLMVGLLPLGAVTITFAAPPSEPASRPLGLIADNLIAYWKLEEASGTRLDELSGCGGTGCDLTDNNTVTQATGKLGNAAQFTSANSEYLSHVDHADLSTGNINFTLAGWVYLDTKVGDIFFFGKRLGTGNQREYNVAYGSGTDRINFRVSSNGTALTTIDASSFGSPTTATWYYLLGWHDATNDVIGICVNNTCDTAAYASGVFDSTAPFTIGANGNPGEYMNGRIDSVGLWKRVLTSDERACLYNAGTGLEYPWTACDPTPTPTNTHTFTPSNTPTETFTPSNTPTDTLTPSNTPTDTPIPPTATDTPIPPTPTDTPTPQPSALCADSYTFPLDTGDVYTVDLCSNVDGMVVGGGVMAILVLLGVVFMRTQIGRWT